MDNVKTQELKTAAQVMADDTFLQELWQMVKAHGGGQLGLVLLLADADESGELQMTTNMINRDAVSVLRRAISAADGAEPYDTYVPVTPS